MRRGCVRRAGLCEACGLRGVALAFVHTSVGVRANNVRHPRHQTVGQPVFERQPLQPDARRVDEVAEIVSARFSTRMSVVVVLSEGGISRFVQVRPFHSAPSAPGTPKSQPPRPTAAGT